MIGRTPYESYIYSVNVDGDSLMYVLEGAYDEIFSDIDAHGMKPLPLYGDWELIFED